MNVSLIALIANPEKYHGKEVRVIGYLNVEFEGNAIYVHQSDFGQSIYKNGLWIETPLKVEAPLDKFSKHYVLMEGTFNAKNYGHRGGWSGALENVTRLEMWPPNQ